MAADGSRGPRPYKQVQASTAFLRVPRIDWPAVSRGGKREFRGGAGRTSGLHSVEVPTPVVAYSEHRVSNRPVGYQSEIEEVRYDARLMVLEERWQEPLGAISEESLAAEGFESLAEFRSYWIRREHRKFMPLREIIVYRVRPWEESEDRERFAMDLLERLYGAWL